MSGLLITLLGGLAFLCVAMGAWSLRTLFVPDHSMRDRVARATRGTITTRETTSLFGSGADDTPPRFQFSQIAAPATEEERGLLRQKLIQGGFRSTTNLEQYLSARAVCALLPPLAAMAFVGGLKLQVILVLLLGSAAIGYYLPAALLDWRIRLRQAAILRPFPDALDLLVCCVEAGLGLDAAFR